MHKTAWTPNQYPQARRSDHVDVYKSETKGEVKVPDPYNWLEENTPETERWINDQEAYTRRYLDQNPNREKLEKAIEENMNYARVRSIRIVRGALILISHLNSSQHRI